jgi:hypothetical protein
MIPAKKYTTVLYCKKLEVVRLTEDKKIKYADVMSHMFPASSEAYKKKLWASYRNGKVIISEGFDSGERGVPKPDAILAQVTKKIQSLHQFFCVCEALFRQVDADRKYEAVQKMVHTFRI